jgi:hypothetical protein
LASHGLVNHWTTLPRWPDGRRLWAVYITFAGEPALHSLVTEYQYQLADVAGLDLIDPAWLHLTLQGIAFTDELRHGRIWEVYDRIETALAGRPPLELVAHPPEIDRDAVALRISPIGEPVALRQLIVETAREVLGREPYRLPEPTGGFRPHVSLAYANTTIAGAGLIRRLARVPHVDLELRVSYLSMIELRREHRRWTWDREYRMPLQRRREAVPVR